MGQQRRTRIPIPRQAVLGAVATIALSLAVVRLLRWRALNGLAIAAGIGLAVALIVWWVVVLPARQAPPISAEDLAAIGDPKARLEAADARIKLRSDLRNGALQLLIAMAVLAGAVLGWQQLAADRDQAAADRELTRQGQASQRFTQAIDQLGSSRVETRIGGVYGLAQIAEQAADTNGPVGEVLLAFVNRQPRPKNPLSLPLAEHAPDVQAALTVLTTSDTDANGQADYEWIVHRLDLHELGLADADLADADLHGANLHGADLASVDFGGANLHSATLREANLLAATLREADLTDADLHSAILSRADLEGATLAGATLAGAELEGATLAGANLRGATLDGANLRGADLTGTTLAGAILTDADLTGARCTGPCPRSSP